LFFRFRDALGENELKSHEKASTKHDKGSQDASQGRPVIFSLIKHGENVEKSRKNADDGGEKYLK
jgi:hypothetical protein